MVAETDGLEMRSGPRGKRDRGAGFAADSTCFGCAAFFFACVLRGINDVVVVTTFAGGVSVFSSGGIPPLVSRLGTSGSTGLGAPFAAGFDLFGGGSMANNPPPAPPCPFGLGLFFEGSSSSVRDGFGRSTMICFFAGFGGRVAWCGFGARGGEPISSSSESLDSESE